MQQRLPIPDSTARPATFRCTPEKAAGDRWEDHPPRGRSEHRAARAGQLLLCLIGMALLAWGCTDKRFRDVEGSLHGPFCLLLANAAAVLLMGCLMGSRWRSAALWAALAMLGQAATLQLIDAGPTVRYQHFRLQGGLGNGTSWLIVALQTVLVAVGIHPYGSTIRLWLTQHFRPWQLICLGVIFFATSATLSREPSVYVTELCLATFLQVVTLANLILVGTALPESVLASLRRWFGKLLGEGTGSDASRFGGLDRFALGAAAWVTLTSAALSCWVYERHPHVPDEVVYLYHARYFAQGKLSLPLPSVPDAFDVDLMHYEADRWYCPVPPGWPAALALGVLLGAPWAVNPLLSGANVLLAYVLVRKLYDRPTARLAVLLLCVSPWNLFLGMSFMTHTFTLTCALVAAVSVANMRSTGNVLWGLLGGAGIGLVSLVRPLEGLVVAGLLGMWSLAPPGFWRRLMPAGALVAGTILVGGLVLPYNAALSGSPFKAPIMAYTDKYYGDGTNALGFGPNRGLGWSGLDPLPGHGFLDVLINTNFNLFATNVELFGWATGSLLVMAVLVFSRCMSCSDRLMLTVIAAIVGIHSLYWFSGGPDFGARYWFLILVPCVVLTARGVQLLGEKLESEPAGTPGGRTRLLTGVFCLSALALITFVPWRALDKYHHYRGMRPDIRELAREHHFGRSLVLIQGKRHPDYASAAIYNPLDLNADAPVYAWDKSPEIRARLFDAYPDRLVWMVSGPTLTGRGFEVTQGPISAAQMRAAAANYP